MLMSMVSACPRKSESLILHFLHILTEGIKPPPQLITLVKSVYAKKGNDPRFLVPIIAGLEKVNLLLVYVLI